LIKNIRRLNGVLDKMKVKDGMPLPSIIELSLIDSCNRTCENCPRSNTLVAPNNNVWMDIALIRRLRTDLKTIGFNGIVVFSGFGEPLLYPFLMEAIETLSEVAKVDVVTNADYLNKVKMQEMIDLGMNKMLISLYNKNRLKPIQAIVEDFDTYKYELRLRWEMFPISNRGGILNDYGIDTPCYYTAYTMVIDWNGDVLLCPHDWHRKVKFGNITLQSLWSIWTSPEFIARRKSLFKSRSGLSPCNLCDVGGTLLGKKHKEAWCKS
jgi:radical SAM protein with 4Fe4S-binding SPASM domain